MVVFVTLDHSVSCFCHSMSPGGFSPSQQHHYLHYFEHRTIKLAATWWRKVWCSQPPQRRRHYVSWETWCSFAPSRYKPLAPNKPRLVQPLWPITGFSCRGIHQVFTWWQTSGCMMRLTASYCKQTWNRGLWKLFAWRGGRQRGKRVEEWMCRHSPIPPLLSLLNSLFCYLSQQAELEGVGRSVGE